MTITEPTQSDGASLPPPTGPRTTVSAPRSGWRLQWRGRVYHESDLKGAHLAFVALLSGDDDWQAFDLRELDPRIGPVRTMYLLAAFQAVEQGYRAADEDGSGFVRIIQEISEAPAEEIAAALVVDD